ncbi:MAG: MATE family efflux transporter [Spirochaetae bacterium HGW-Spirochaetae-8]|jgi:putative MATE family efflux protein|nr:MAG: MATE family efflux transporter [Spirochaetae bacterium HGW-Spirochaetae-8]
MKTDRIRLLGETPVRKAIFVLAMPVVVGMMVQVFYNLVDTYFIGKLGDPNQLAAANLAMPVFVLMMAIAGIIGTGASSYISRCLGEDRKEQAEKTLATGLAISFGIGLVVTVLGIAFIRPLVSLLGSSSDTFPYAYTYVLVLVIGSIPVMCNYAIGQLLRAEGDAMGSMFGMFLGTVLNIVLDPLLIFVFKMGVGGAAIATVLGNTASLLFYLYRYHKGKTLLRIHPKLISFEKVIMREIFTIGVPASLSQAFMGASMVVLNNIAASYSDIVVAGLGVSLRIITIGTFIFMGIAAGCQPLIGFNYGARNLKRVRSVVLNGMAITTIVGVVLGGLIWIFARPVIGIFSSVEEVRDSGMIILRALVISLPFVGGQMLCTITVQAMGKAIPALFLSISRQGLIFLPLLFLLDALFGFKGFIFAQPITDILMLLISFTLLSVILRKIDAKTVLARNP